MIKKRRLNFIIIIVILVVGIIGFFIYNKLSKDNKVPNYDFNDIWSCSKTNSDSTRTYIFKKNGEVRAELDSNSDDNYLVGTYKILDFKIDTSVFSGEREGKIKSYDLEIIFSEYVESGIDKDIHSVKWYADVYNGNYMKLTLSGGSYHCTMK